MSKTSPDRVTISLVGTTENAVAYQRRRRRKEYVDWRAFHDYQRSRVSRQFGGFDEDVKNVFFRLSPLTFSRFLDGYGSRYGPRAQAYARSTYPKWQSGEIEPSAQTLERLLEMLPPYLAAPEKCELLRKLRERFRRTESHSVTVSTANWRQVVIPLAEHLVHKAYHSQLPAQVTARLTWLSAGSVQATNALLAEAEAVAARNTIAFLDKEFANIRNVMANLPFGRTVTHEISLPYGQITVRVKEKHGMEHEKTGKEIEKITSARSVQKRAPSDLLNHALENLTDRQVNELSEQAAKEALSIQAERVRADDRFQNAQRDMNDFVRTAADVGRISGTDHKMQGSFESASGTTHIQVSKSTGLFTIVIAVAIAALLILIFLSRS